jgi:(E)-4-hydroxy-3-methylbut-2-enyl-diphosphate synthase
VAPVFIDGQRDVTLKGEHIAQEFQAIVENYVRRTYGKQQDHHRAAAEPVGAQ